MPEPSTMWGTAFTTQFTNPASFHINLAAESCWREANFEGKERMRRWGRKLSGEQHSGIHWVPLDIRRGLGVSAEVHGGLWRPLWDPSCSPRAHTVHSDMCTSRVAGVWWVFLPATLTLGATISLLYVIFGDIIWLTLNLGLYNTERFVIIEPTDVRMSGWHGKLSGSFSQVSKQSRFKIQ